MSTTSLPQASARINTDTDRHSHLDTPAYTDEKHSSDAIIAESKRLIKAGYYKKAFNLVENLKHDLQLTPTNHLKLCRRMTICLSKICTRYLLKGDLQRLDHIMKLMQKSWDYLQTWHDLLSDYIIKTNPKYAHLLNLLDDVSDSFDGEYGSPMMMRVKPRKETNPTPNNNLTNMSVGDTRPSFMNKTKNTSISAIKDKRAAYLEDTAQENVRVATEPNTQTVTAQDINAGFHLDEFMKYFLLSLLNWADFYKKGMRKYNLAYRILTIAHNASKPLNKCLDPELLQVVSKIKLSLGIFYCEFERYHEATEVLESAVTTIQLEISLRINQNSEENENKNEFVLMQRFKGTMRFLILVFMNLSIAYECKGQFARCVESLKLGVWFASKYIAPDDEIYQVVNNQHHMALLKYERFLKEIAEAERFTGNREKLPGTNNQDDKTTNAHFDKVNTHIYNKFNYEKLNQSQVIVIATPAPQDSNSTFQNNFDINLEDRTDTYENWKHSKKSVLKPRDLTLTVNADLSNIKLTTQDGHDSPRTIGSSWKMASSTGAKITIKEKKKKDRKLSLLSPDVHHKRLTSEIYRAKNMTANGAEEEELNSDEEREYIQKLNRNIKDRTKMHRKNIKPKENGFFDLDQYFGKVVEEQIKEKEDEMHEKPTDFKSTIKNYAKFIKAEAFDSREFTFAKKVLVAKSRESFCEHTIEGKYKSPGLKSAEVNGFKIEAQHTEAKLAAEKTIQQRLVSAKGMNKSASIIKQVKFASSPDAKENKVMTLAALDEGQKSNRGNMKPNLANILFKHKTELNLTTVHNAVKDIQSLEKKEEKLRARQKLEGKPLSVISSPHNVASPKHWRALSLKNTEEKTVNPEQMVKYAQTTKNVIELMMESVEKTIQEDIYMRKKVEENKPLVSFQKASDKRFLKFTNELANSTVNLALKGDGQRKRWNFTQLVKGAQVLSNKKVQIQEPSKMEL